MSNRGSKIRWTAWTCLMAVLIICLSNLCVTPTGAVDSTSVESSTGTVSVGKIGADPTSTPTSTTTTTATGTGTATQTSTSTTSSSSASTATTTPTPTATPTTSGPAPPSPSSGDEGMSGGSKFLLWFFVLTTLYVCGGIVYNRFQDRTGWDLFPHYDFWREFVSLVMDGYYYVTGRRTAASSGYTSFEDDREDTIFSL